MSEQSLMAEVLGISNPADKERALNEAHDTLIGGPFNYLEYHRLHVTPSQLLSRSDNERRVAMLDIKQIVEGEPLQSAHTLMNWAAYAAMMDAYGTRSNGTATALMIGSLSALSSRSFDCLARTEYGAGNTYVIDPFAGVDKIKHSTFIQGSGLTLPFRSESIDIVHTNRLLHMLIDPSSPTRPRKQRALMLFAEIGRVLSPGGQLLMTEMPREDEISMESGVPIVMAQMQKFAQFIGTSLQRSGLGEQTEVNYAQSYNVTAYLRDPTRNFEQHRQRDIIDLAVLDIYARKPARVQ